MRYYCPNCWKDFWNQDFAVCPECGYDAKAEGEKDYTEKLLRALNHPSGEIQQWAIMILSKRKEKQAIPYLEKLIKETRNPLLVKQAQKAIEKIIEEQDQH